MMRHMKSALLLTLALAFLAGCGRLPDDVMMEKAKAHETAEEFLKAIEMYEKIVSLYPRSQYAPEALYRAGLVYANGLHDTEKAVFNFGRVMSNYSESEIAPQCQFMTGFVYANSASDTTQARLAYQKFLELFPDHELVPSVEWELKYLGKDINEIPELQGLEEQADE